jgi:hypothetical protein
MRNRGPGTGVILEDRWTLGPGPQVRIKGSAPSIEVLVGILKADVGDHAARSFGPSFRPSHPQPAGSPAGLCAHPGDLFLPDQLLSELCFAQAHHRRACITLRPRHASPCEPGRSPGGPPRGLLRGEPTRGLARGKTRREVAKHSSGRSSRRCWPDPSSSPWSRVLRKARCFSIERSDVGYLDPEVALRGTWGEDSSPSGAAFRKTEVVWNRKV